MKRLIIIILLAIGLQSMGQVNWTPGVGAWQLKDTTGGKNVRFRSNTGVITPIITQPSLSDSLKNYAKIQDGVITSPTVSTLGDSLIIGNGVVRINGENINFIGKTFADIPPSSANLIRIFIVYSNTSGVLDSISGVQSNNPVPPDLPSNTQSVISVSVSDAGLGVPQVDLSGYAKLKESNTFTGLIKIRTLPNYSALSTPDIRFTGASQGVPDTNFFRIKAYNPSNNNLYFTRLPSFQDDLEWNYTTGVFDFKQIPTVNGDPIGSGGGTVTSVSSSLASTGTDISLSVANQTTTPVINLSIPTASSSNRGALTSADWNTFNNKAPATGATGYIQNGTGLQTSSNFYISGTGRATNFGAGIAPNANARYVAAAGTSTIGQFLWTPSASYAGTENGMMNYNSGDSTLRMMRFGSSDQVIFNNNNPSFKLSGLPRLVETNSSGGLAATKPIVSILVTDSDVITAITGATYTSDRATITPVSSKVMYIGQIYDDGTYTYIAIDNNVVRRW